MGITVRDFLELACDDSYTVSVYDTFVDVTESGEVRDWLNGEINSYLVDCEIQSWDFDFLTKEFTLNVDSSEA